MAILIVEDDPFKYNEIKELLAEIRPDIELIVVNSVKGARSALSNQSYVCIFLDIALPSHDLQRGKGAPASLPSGGLEVLYELSYCERDDPVIIITQYPSIEIEGKLIPLSRVAETLTRLLDVNLRGAVQFDKYTIIWKSDVIDIMEKMVD